MTPKNPVQRRSFTFSFSPAGFFALILFAILALAWAFIFGLLLGRGYQPEELIPEIAKVMPTPPPPPPNVTESLRPEDLNFYEQLKNMPIKEEPVASSTQQAKLSPKQEKRPKKVISPKNSARQKTTSKQKKTAPEKQKIAAKSKAQTPPKTTRKKTQRRVPKKEEVRFFYRYQISSLKDGATALGQQKRIEAKGIKASITKVRIKETNWYRIFVQFQGTQKDVKTIATRLKKMGFPNMILADKKRLN